MTRFILAIPAFALLLHAAPVHAQSPWAVELRGSGAVPTGAPERDELQTGIGFEGTLSYRMLPHLAAYAGWGWTQFGSDQSFAGADMDFEETGYALGLRFEHPLRGEGPQPLGVWLRAGATIDHIEVEDDEGHLVDDSGHGLGWEAGAGLAVAIGPRWSLTPGVRYRALSRDIEVDGVTTPMDLRYAAFEVGFRRGF